MALANRAQHVIALASAEVENSEDPKYRAPVQAAALRLKTAVPVFLSTLTAAAATPRDATASAKLQALQAEVKEAVAEVRRAMHSDVVVDQYVVLSIRAARAPSPRGEASGVGWPCCITLGWCGTVDRAGRCVVFICAPCRLSIGA